MNPTETLLLHLLDSALRETPPDPARFEGADWPALLSLAQEHKIDALLIDALCLLPEPLQPPPEVFAPWQQQAMMTMFSQALLAEQLHRLLAAFEAAGLRVVVLKGVALKPLYPQPDLRTMSDADLLIGESDAAAGLALAESQGFTLIEEEPGVKVLGGQEGLRVELHARLFDQTAYGFLSRLDEAALFPLSITARGAVYGGEAWLFPPLEHALFMLCHMAKHLITTGFGLRQTADLALFVGAYDAEIDWARFWAIAGDLGLSAFAAALLDIGARYLSLPEGRWAADAPRSAEAADALLLDILQAGVFGNQDDARRRSAAVVYRAYDAKDANRGRILRALFPSPNTLKAPYLYARRRPALLPVAWVHRWAVLAFGLLTGRVKRGEMTQGLSIADQRLGLLSQLGLRDDQK
ncbi:MAG: nucleotidyltransferase family protein [Oscillospiraceae bacterium]|jgi:hypothetical protein|nr:nucleotidyltransferase family protein [Oscillospiraceae bacterium]